MLKKQVLKFVGMKIMSYVCIRNQITKFIGFRETMAHYQIDGERLTLIKPLASNEKKKLLFKPRRAQR